MDREFQAIAAATGLGVAFAVVSLLADVTGGHPRLVKVKLRVGALLLSVSATSSGCYLFFPTTCYISFDTDSGLTTDQDDTGPIETTLDTGIEMWHIGGSGVYFDQVSYVGSTRMANEVVGNSAGQYEVGDVLCEYIYPAAHHPTHFAPELPCVGCDMAFSMVHEPYTSISQEGNFCEVWYGTSMDDGSWWNMGIGFHPDYAGGGPSLMYYSPADTPDWGDPAEWMGVPYPYAKAAWDPGAGTFKFWMMQGLYYY